MSRKIVCGLFISLSAILLLTILLISPPSSTLQAQNPPTPRPTATTIPLHTPIPTLPADFPKAELGYRWLLHTGFVPVLWAGDRIIEHWWDSVVAVNPQDGTAFWRYTVPVGYSLTNIQLQRASVFLLLHGGAGLTSLRIVALDSVSGSTKWDVVLPAVPQRTTPSIDYPESFAVNETSVQLYDHQAKMLYAFEPANGNTRWQRKGCARLFGASADHLYAVCEGAGLSVLDAQSGSTLITTSITVVQQVWPFGTAGLVTMDASIRDVLHPRKFVFSGRSPNDLALRWQREMSGTLGFAMPVAEDLLLNLDRTVYRIRAADGSIVWQVELAARGKTITRDGSLLLIGSNTGDVYALDWATGFQLWHYDLFTALQPAWSSVNIIGRFQDTLLFTGFAHDDDKAVVAIFALSQAALPIWPTATPSPMASPAATEPPAAIYSTDFSLKPAPDQWQVEPEPPLAQRTPSVNPAIITATDFDQDGDTDFILNLFAGVNRRADQPQTPDVQCIGLARCPRSFILFEQRAGQYLPVLQTDLSYLGRYDSWNAPLQVVYAGDLNGEPHQEIVITGVYCGSTGCFPTSGIVMWSAREGWHLEAIFDGQASVIESQHDGKPKLEIAKPGTCRNRLRISRRQRLIYEWEEDGFKLVETINEPDAFMLFRVEDAFNALQQGDEDRALALAMDVIGNPLVGEDSYCHFLFEGEDARIVSYAGVLAMLVHALHNEPGAIDAILNEITVRYTRADNVYVPAAQQFAAVYHATNDPLVACQSVDRFLRQQFGQANLLNSFEYGWLGCPFK